MSDYVIDGKQRLATIIIFMSALFARLKSIIGLSEDEEIYYEDMVKRRSVIRFRTVDYDDRLFIDNLSPKNCPQTVPRELLIYKIINNINYLDIVDTGSIPAASTI